ncbi:hypothetical protein B0T10DRAFT_492351 [Thelonectria olida]|uniref:Uncharacterized protein n=1 Tax=Thelonectria olida TaxID=1576542 RepID=A0A9P8W019_9HYPO|nr:hypothetical protein B0T10DRAFT_492351 [Thelonectria olida]
MKVTAILIAAMAAFGAAEAAPGKYGCQPGTYQCSGKTGWQVCNTSGVWVNGGTCPPKTICKFYPPSKSPYCVPPGFQFKKE